MTRRRGARRGTAVVAALGMLLLAAALLASAAMASSSAATAARAARASLAAETTARWAVADALARLGAAEDSLVPGRDASRPMALPVSPGMTPVTGTVAVRRVGASLFAITADVRAGAEPALASRRVRLLVRRAAGTDSLAPPFAPIARWSLSDLY